MRQQRERRADRSLLWTLPLPDLAQLRADVDTRHHVAGAISPTRLCCTAEHADADTAWGLLARAGQVAASLFASWDACWDSVRTATAFGSDSLAARVPWSALTAAPGR